VRDGEEPTMNPASAFCSDCGAVSAPANPEEPDTRRWQMPPGWVLVPHGSGVWARRCTGCEKRERERYQRFLQSPHRMSMVLAVLRDFWERFPERQLSEIVALAARLRHTPMHRLSDCDLAGVLHFWCITESDYELVRDLGAGGDFATPARPSGTSR